MTEPQPRLFLIDGSSYIFRAFFAIPPLSNARGLPTNAILGFTDMLLRLVKPEYIAVLLDAGRETFRHQMFAAYKGHRLDAPADLVRQFPYFRKVLDALNLTLLELPEYEADDIIATLCRELAGRDCGLMVVSGDKDMMQLVNDGIKLLDSSKERWISAADVKEKFGVAPEQVTEVVGLMGDAVDNIPGVKGIGKKTAIVLIQQYQTLENLYVHLDDVEKSKMRGAARIRKILEDGREKAFLSRRLATVKADVPIQIALNYLRARAPDLEKARVLFNELGFFNLLKLLEFNQPA
jgi:5'-3' exonuclease